MRRSPGTPYAAMNAEEQLRAIDDAREVLRAAYDQFVTESVQALGARVREGSIRTTAALRDAVAEFVMSTPYMASAGAALEVVQYSPAVHHLANWRVYAEVGLTMELHSRILPYLHEQLHEQALLESEPPPHPRPKP